jgi:uncharacterized protein HemX
MVRLCALVSVVALGLVLGSVSFGQDKKDGQDTPGKARQLPANWSKLGLSEKQKQQAHKIRAEYGHKIEVLRKQIRQLEEEERGELSRVLTDEQKNHLKEILAGKAGISSKDEKKPDGK